MRIQMQLHIHKHRHDTHTHSAYFCYVFVSLTHSLSLSAALSLARSRPKSHNFPIKRKWAIYLPWNQWESPIKISSFCRTRRSACCCCYCRVVVAVVVFRFGCRKCNAKCLPPLQLFIMRMAMAAGGRVRGDCEWVSAWRGVPGAGWEGRWQLQQLLPLLWVHNCRCVCVRVCVRAT